MATKQTDLERRLAELEAENARLRASANGGVRGAVKATKKKQGNGWVDDPTKPTKIEIRIGNTWPLSYNVEQWRRVFDNIEAIQAIVGELEDRPIGTTAMK